MECRIHEKRFIRSVIEDTMWVANRRKDKSIFHRNKRIRVMICYMYNYIHSKKSKSIFTLPRKVFRNIFSQMQQLVVWQLPQVKHLVLLILLDY